MTKSQLCQVIDVLNIAIISYPCVTNSAKPWLMQELPQESFTISTLISIFEFLAILDPVGYLEPLDSGEVKDIQDSVGGLQPTLGGESPFRRNPDTLLGKASVFYRFLYYCVARHTSVKHAPIIIPFAA